jgi:rubredoxin
MSQPSPTCPDCKVPMDSGLIVDFTYGTDSSEQPIWVEGTAEPSWWTGGLKLGDKERLPVVTFRCPQCGQLKSFALATS